MDYLSFGFLQKNLNKFNFELNRRDIFNNYSSKFYIFPHQYRTSENALFSMIKLNIFYSFNTNCLYFSLFSIFLYSLIPVWAYFNISLIPLAI